MSYRRLQLRAGLLAAALAFGAGFGQPAAASDPVPGDAFAPPVNINIGMLYDEFSDAGTFGAVHGSNYTKNTHISTNIVVGRYIRTFDIGGFLSGVQVFLPYVSFLGGQEVGVRNIAGPYVPALGGQLPAYGPGRASLTHNSGFAQPNIGLFSFLINKPETGTYWVVGPWIDPPVSSFNKNDNLNPDQNVWIFEPETGFRATLIGAPTTQNLTIELWGAAYFFTSNNHSALVTPSVSANAIPASYAIYNALSGGAIPDSNPLQAASVTPASFHEQPKEEIHIYLPYQFAPSTLGFIAPGFYQSFGGKQTYTLQNGAKVDSGNRTEETQLRLAAGTFVSPSVQLMAIGEYDLAAHGEPLNRTVLFRVLKFF